MEYRLLSTPPGVVRSVAGGLARSVRPHRRATGDPDDRVFALAAQRIDTDRLATYQRLCGFRTGADLPPTFPHLLAFPLAIARMTEPDFPFPVLGLVHVANVIDQRRALDVSERLDLRVWAADRRDHRAGQQIDIVAEVRSADDVVWTSRSTYLHREAQPGGRDRSKQTVESALVTAIIRIPKDIGRRYAAISGDRNPIHLHAVTARAFGFPRPIAHGMWLAARALATLEGRLTPALEYEVAFKAPAFLPSAVAVDSSRDQTGWTIGLRGARDGRPHLDGRVVER